MELIIPVLYILHNWCGKTMTMITEIESKLILIKFYFGFMHLQVAKHEEIIPGVGIWCSVKVLRDMRHASIQGHSFGFKFLFWFQIQCPTNAFLGRSQWRMAKSFAPCLSCQRFVLSSRFQISDWLSQCLFVGILKNESTNGRYSFSLSPCFFLSLPLPFLFF